MQFLLTIIHFFTGCNEYTTIKKFPYYCRYNPNPAIASLQIKTKLVEHVVKSQCQCAGCGRIFTQEDVKIVSDL